MTGPEIIAAAGGIAGTALATYVGLVVRPLEKDLEAEKDARKTEAKNFADRLDAMHDDKKELEKRVTDIERTALNRTELDGVRRDLENAVDRMGDRVLQHFDKTVERMETRLAKVEARHGE